MENNRFFTQQEITDLPKLLSQQRFQRYLEARHDDVDAALRLYQWNLEISGEFLKILHLCEISLRNGVADAISAVHGEEWPWVQGFRISLLSPSRGYSPRRDLETVSNYHQTSGKIIAELKFAFWEKMLNANQQSRLWDTQLSTHFPHLDFTIGAEHARDTLRQKVYSVRALRNRIAHHEPIFYRPALRDDFLNILYVIEARCPISANWIGEIQNVSEMLDNIPE